MLARYLTKEFPWLIWIFVGNEYNIHHLKTRLVTASKGGSLEHLVENKSERKRRHFPCFTLQQFCARLKKKAVILEEYREAEIEQILSHLF